MSALSFIDPARDPRWDRFVETHPNGLICHLSGWKEVLERSFSHMKGYFPVLTNPIDGTIQAGLPVYLVRSPITGRHLVSVPFATLSDPLVSSQDQLRTLLSAVTSLALESSASHIEIRTLATSSLMSNSGFAKSDTYSNHFLMLDEPIEQIRKRFHRTGVRRMVNRSELNGLALGLDNSYASLQCFYGSYVKTRKRLGLPPQPLRFFEHLREVFGPSARLRLLHAHFRGKSVGTLIVFHFNHRVSAEFMGIDEEYKHLHISHFLIWNAIKLSREEGFQIFDLGRTSIHNTNLMLFKQRWGTSVAALPQFWYAANGRPPSGYRETALSYRLVRHLTRRTPIRLLPLVGELCYRHMG